MAELTRHLDERAARCAQLEAECGRGDEAHLQAMQGAAAELASLRAQLEDLEGEYANGQRSLHEKEERFVLIETEFVCLSVLFNILDFYESTRIFENRALNNREMLDNWEIWLWSFLFVVLKSIICNLDCQKFDNRKTSLIVNDNLGLVKFF